MREQPVDLRLLAGRVWLSYERTGDEAFKIPR